MPFKRCVAALALLASMMMLRAAEPGFVLTGKAAVGKDYLFSLKNNTPGAKAEWLTLGGKIGDHVLTEYDHSADILTLKRGDETVQVPMQVATVLVKIDPVEKRQRDLARMAAMKPALEGGQPIRGDLLLLVNGEVRQEFIELVIGREARIDAGAEGTFVILPALNPNGTVSYAISLAAKDAGGAPGEIKLKAKVTQTPWGSFNFATANGRGFGFIPVTDEPAR